MTAGKKYFWHPMAHPNQKMARATIKIVSADGVYLKDESGKSLLDGNAGLSCVNVGHNRPEIKAAIAKQLDELEFFQLFDRYSHPRAEELATKLVNMAQPENISKVFFTSGGSDSVETALKLARQFHVISGRPERKKFISLKNSYHGTHFGGSAVTGMNAIHRVYEPMLANCIHVDTPYLYRNPWGCDDPEQLVAHCINQLISEVEYQGPDTIAAFIAEPVLGSGGMIVPPEDYWPRLREVCDKYGILLIADEVMTGLGRTGALFGCRGWGVSPDIMCLAKGVTSAYIPIGAVLINERLEQAWNNNTDLLGMITTGCTFAGHPVGCAAGLAALDIVEKENLAENARVQGDYLLNKLKPFVDKFKSVGEVRGKGLMIALELVVDTTTREGVNTDFSYQISDMTRSEGVLVRPMGGNKIGISPPLIFTTEHCDQLVDVLDKVLTKVDS